jgi:hypothetical protein
MRVCLRTLQYVTLNLSQVRWRSGGHEAGSLRNLCVAGSTAMRRLLLRLKSWGRAMSTFCLLTLSCTFDWGAPMANVRQQSTPSCRFQGFQSHLNRGAMVAATSCSATTSPGIGQHLWICQMHGPAEPHALEVLLLAKSRNGRAPAGVATT